FLRVLIQRRRDDRSREGERWRFPATRISMKKPGWFVLSTAAVALSVLPSWGAPAGRPATVGDFVYRISRAMGRQPVDQAAARTALRNAGVDLGHDAGAVLTAGQVAGILGGLGLSLAEVQDAGATISSAKADQIVKGVVLMRGGTLDIIAQSSQGNCP